jgi:predicted nucleotidyltransferase
MFQDYLDLLSSFNDHGVKYMVIGGYAVSYHAQPRATKDLDIFIQADAENAKAIYAALSEFGAPMANIREADFCDQSVFMRIGREPWAIDILSRIDGIDFETAWENRTRVKVDETRKLFACFISDDDLITTKLAAGRPQDLADVAALRKASRAKGQRDGTG